MKLKEILPLQIGILIQCNVKRKDILPSFSRDVLGLKACERIGEKIFDYLRKTGRLRNKSTLLHSERKNHG